LGSKKGLASQALLLLAGALGFNVFSAGTGIATVLGPTGGYLLGFLLSAYVAGQMSETKALKGFWKSFGLLFVASLFIFLPGVVWLKTLTHTSWISALQMGFIPFMIGDVVKTLAVTLTFKILK
jgi:biotin transport system substrate-specific component